MEKIPNYIYCSITGLRFAVRREIMLDRIKQAGSLERLQKTYVSRDSRRLLKAGKTIEEIRSELGYEAEHANNNLTFETARGSSSMAKVRIRQGDHIDAFWQKPGYKIGITPGVCDSTLIANITKAACMFPNIFLDDNCSKCRWFEHCTFARKRLPKIAKK